MSEQGVNLEFTLAKYDFDGAGQASSKLKRLLQQIGVRPEVIRRIAVSAYEAEMNVIIHSQGGKMLAVITPGQTVLEFVDSGPGIADIEKAMTEGYSTAPDHIREKGFGAGMGLPNMKRCADQFDISSTVGTGTRIKMSFNH
ncbi:MAG: ATP-binding protein [Negativicutes bacterium]|nr:ATP-binding protein [Negativicutes bacterium]